MEEHTATVDDTLVHWRQAPAAGTPPLYLHGVPTSSDDWAPFLERAGGVALDLPGFGRSGKRGDFDYSIAGYDAFLEKFLDHLGLDRVRMVVHDWGAVGLALAQRLPARIDRLVISNAVPFLPGYRWHRIARIWRTPVLGELFMGTSSKAAFRFLSREANAAPGPLPTGMVDSIWRHFDPGTQRAILRLYRSAPADVLAAAGRNLGRIEAPALVVWGQEDPYIDSRFGPAYADALSDARLLAAPGAGHWPWVDKPELVDEICGFLAG